MIKFKKYGHVKSRLDEFADLHRQDKEMFMTLKQKIVTAIIGKRCAIFNAVIEAPNLTPEFFAVQSNRTDFMFYNVLVKTKPILKTSMVYSKNYYNSKVLKTLEYDIDERR